jgi:hypothetical protein
MSGKTQLDYLQSIEANTHKEHDFQLVLSKNSSDFVTPIYPPMQLEPNKWSIGLRNFTVYNNISNIDLTNNLFRYSIDSGTTWKLITLTPGAYEIATINSEIVRLMAANGDAGITILPDTVTFGTIIEITPATYRVDFTIANSIRTVLGFDAGILSTGRNTSQNEADIININIILINCDIVSNSYVNGSPFPCIYSFPFNVDTGFRFVEQPTNILYLPLNTFNISSIRIWVTDQNGKSIKFGTQELTCTLHFKYL